MKRLILGSIPENFNPQKDIPLGPFCFLNKEHVYPDWETLSFQPDPFQTPEAIAEASQLTSAFSYSLVPELAEKLNKINGTQHSNRFWQFLILPWLLVLIQAVWERQARLLRFIEIYRKDKIIVELIPPDVKWNFKDISDYMERGITNQMYNKWLYSRLLEQNMPIGWKVSYQEIIPEEQDKLKDKSTGRLNKKKVLDKLIYLRCYGVYGIGILESIIWSLFLSIKPIRSNGTNTNQSYPQVTDTNMKDKFKVNINNIIKLSLPECYINLQLLKTSNLRTIPGKIRMVGPQIYSNERLKYFLGLCIEKGEQLVCTQHGWPYGRAKVSPFHSEYEYKQYRFFSWGWSEHENYTGNIKPMSSPYLAKFKDKHKHKNSKLLYVGALGRLYPLRLETIYPQALQSLEYRQNKMMFLENLKQTIFSKLLYRPAINDIGGIKDRSYIEKKFPNICICSKNFHHELFKCKLLILDNPGTTFTISMVANIPTITFWDKKHWALSKQVVPFFEAMEGAGMIFETGIAAAKKVNEIWDKVETWWAQPDIQEVRENFCHQYARTKRSWRLDWIKELWKL